MLTMQKLMDTFSDISARERSKYHVTLGKLIEALRKANPESVVTFNHNTTFGPSKPHSYRGYYSDLSLGITAPPKVKEFLPLCEEANGNVFEGYKGGDFKMSNDTPLWCASYGECGLAIVDIHITPESVVLQTRDVD